MINVESARGVFSVEPVWRCVSIRSGPRSVAYPELVLRMDRIAPCCSAEHGFYEVHYLATIIVYSLVP